MVYINVKTRFSLVFLVFRLDSVNFYVTKIILDLLDHSLSKQPCDPPLDKMRAQSLIYRLGDSNLQNWFLLFKLRFEAHMSQYVGQIQHFWILPGRP